VDALHRRNATTESSFEWDKDLSVKIRWKWLSAPPPCHLRYLKTTWEHARLSKDKIMLWAAFTMCYFWISMVRRNSSRNRRVLTQQEILSLKNQGRRPKLLRLHCKTDPYSEGSDIFVARTFDELWPLSAILAWLTHQETGNSGTFFHFQSGAPLTYSTFVIQFKEALFKVGIGPTRFAGHSFRIGATTTAAKNGLPDSTIK